MVTRRAGRMSLIIISLQLLLILFIRDSSCTTFHLGIGDHQLQTIQPLQNYTILVDASKAWNVGNYSAFTVQVHSQQYNVTLRNASQDCNIARLCTAVGTSTGLVEILLSQGVFTYEASIRNCSSGVSNSSSSCAGVKSVSIMIAVVGIHAMDPIPGGCAQTSALEYEAAITPYYNPQSTTIYFQGSDIGFLPMGQSIPACDTQTKVISRLEYHIYRHCVSYDNFGEELMFDALQDMLNPLTSTKAELSGKLKYSDPKRVLLDSMTGHGIVYNVVVKDTTTGTMSSYIPVSSYACDFLSGDCKLVIAVHTYFLGILLGIVGLFLCFLAHRFFHLEVFVFSTLIGYFLIYLTLSAVTTWTQQAVAGLSVCLALLLSLLLFTLWFFTGYYYIFVILFGLAMGSLVSATILFTPLGSVVSLLKLNYIYILGFLCVAVLCILPLVAFPVILNITASSLVGSYAVIFCITLFKYSQLQEIVMRVIKNASIHGFLSAQSGCAFQTIDIAFTCLWILLNISGVTVQLILYLIQKKRFRKKQIRHLYGTDPISSVPTTHLRKYPGFPTRSLYRQLMNRLSNKGQYRPPPGTHQTHRSRVAKPRTANDSQSRPLLSPDSSLNAHGNTRYYGT